MPRLLKPNFKIVTSTEDIYNVIEDAARMCYLSEPKKPLPEHSTAKDVLERAAEQANFISDKINKGHESILEHGSITVDFTCDRGVSHEIVRHRIAAYSQESTRYCNYSKDKFSNEIAVIEPIFFPMDGPKKKIVLPDGECEAEMSAFDVWFMAMQVAEWAYMTLLKMGHTPQEARSVLPNSLKTEIRATYDVREWRHFFRLRTAKAAHPQMREIAIPLLVEMKERFPIFFDDIEVEV